MFPAMNTPPCCARRSIVWTAHSSGELWHRAQKRHPGWRQLASSRRADARGRARRAVLRPAWRGEGAYLEDEPAAGGCSTGCSPGGRADLRARGRRDRRGRPRGRARRYELPAHRPRARGRARGAAEIVDAVPLGRTRAARVVRGTEGCDKPAIRLARADSTRRDRVIKFEGGYHEPRADVHSSRVPGPGQGSTLGDSVLPGGCRRAVTGGHDRRPLQRPRRDSRGPVERSRRRRRLAAAILVEPVAGNMRLRVCSPGARLSRGAAASVRRAGRPARVRRGDHGFRLRRARRRCRPASACCS